MESKILQRILQQTDTPQLFEVLTEQLNPSDLQSLMLEVYKKRAEKISPAFLLQQHHNNRFTKKSLLSPLVQLELDQWAYTVAKDIFEPVTLSPLSPLGVCSAIAKVDQKKIVSTIRNVEAIADPTNVLALESVHRRKTFLQKKATASNIVNLCCSQRVTRAQFFDAPHSFGHFQLFALTSAGKDQGNFDFEMESLERHLLFHLRLMTEKSAFEFHDVEVLVLPIETRLEDRVKNLLDRLSTVFTNANFQIDRERTNGVGYYDMLCFTINAANVKKGEKLHLVDGGLTDWTQRLMSNKKERLMISAIGSERVGLEFYKK